MVPPTVTRPAAINWPACSRERARLRRTSSASSRRRATPATFGSAPVVVVGRRRRRPPGSLVPNGRAGGLGGPGARSRVERGQRVAQPPVYILVHLEMAVRLEVVGVGEPRERARPPRRGRWGSTPTVRGARRRGRTSAFRAVRLARDLSVPARLSAGPPSSRSCPDATAKPWGTVDHDGDHGGVPQRTRQALGQSGAGGRRGPDRCGVGPLAELPHHRSGRHVRGASGGRPRSRWPTPCGAAPGEGADPTGDGGRRPGGDGGGRAELRQGLGVGPGKSGGGIP